MRAMPHTITNGIAQVLRFAKTHAAPILAVVSILIAF